MERAAHQGRPFSYLATIFNLRVHVDVAVLEVVEHGAEHLALAVGVVNRGRTIELILRSVRARVADVDERELDVITEPEARSRVRRLRDPCRKRQSRLLRDLGGHHGSVAVDEETARV